MGNLFRRSNPEPQFSDIPPVSPKIVKETPGFPPNASRFTQMEIYGGIVQMDDNNKGVHSYGGGWTNQRRTVHCVLTAPHDRQVRSKYSERNGHRRTIGTVDISKKTPFW